MSSDRANSGLTVALIACLSVGILLLGIELSFALGQSEQLPVARMSVLLVAAVLLYAALAWRGSRSKGGTVFARWWGTMLLCHVVLGVTVGMASAATTPTPADAEDK